MSLTNSSPSVLSVITVLSFMRVSPGCCALRINGAAMPAPGLGAGYLGVGAAPTAQIRSRESAARFMVSTDYAVAAGLPARRELWPAAAGESPRRRSSGPGRQAQLLGPLGSDLVHLGEQHGQQVL